MKAKILFCTLLFSALTALTVSCSNDTNPSSENQSFQFKDDDGLSGSVKTVWTIGRKSRNCFGIGICKYVKTVVKVEDIEVDLSKLKQEKIIYTVTVPKSLSTGGKVAMLWQIRDASYDYIQEYFHGEHIIFEEDTQFNTSEIPGFEKTFTIAKGTYPLAYNPNSDAYEVMFENIE